MKNSQLSTQIQKALIPSIIIISILSTILLSVVFVINNQPQQILNQPNLIQDLDSQFKVDNEAEEPAVHQDDLKLVPGTYRSEDLGIEFDYPKSWKITETPRAIYISAEIDTDYTKKNGKQKTTIASVLIFTTSAFDLSYGAIPSQDISTPGYLKTFFIDSINRSFKTVPYVKGEGGFCGSGQLTSFAIKPSQDIFVAVVKSKGTFQLDLEACQRADTTKHSAEEFGPVVTAIVDKDTLEKAKKVIKSLRFL